MKDTTIHPQATIKEATEALDKIAERVLLVVNDGQVLIGTLTDGDIRRYILRGGELSGTIQSAYQTNPIFVFQFEKTAKGSGSNNSINEMPKWRNSPYQKKHTLRTKAAGCL